MRNFRAMTVTFCENIAVFCESFVSYREKFRKNYAWNRKTLAFFAKVKPLINSRKLLIINSYSFIRDTHVINFFSYEHELSGLNLCWVKKIYDNTRWILSYYLYTLEALPILIYIINGNTLQIFKDDPVFSCNAATPSMLYKNFYISVTHWSILYISDTLAGINVL